jgi:predicted phosphodiesterase
MLSFDTDRPLLVFGGPYSNLRATAAVRREADRLGIPASRVICTGDIVAYCAEPAETAAAIRDWGCHAIQGNCEEQLAAGAADCGCNFEEGTACDLLAKGWYPFAAARVPRELCDWMGSLPLQLDFGFGGLSFRALHGGGSQINRWVFASDEQALAEEVRIAGCDVVIAGHCGMPFIARSGAATWFNPGVIGMPANDGTSDVWYGLISLDNGAVKLSTHRLAYDHSAAAAALRRHGHANGYARTLVTGIWPSFDVLPATEKAATGSRIKARSIKISPQRQQSAA